jgi:predicted transcriptional regulator
LTWYQSLRRRAVEKLGGLVCRGLSFIGGPDCPVPNDKLNFQDINLSHRKSEPQAPSHYEYEVLKMKNPESKFILLCSLCNQRMRHLAKEFRRADIPKKAISLYARKWSLEEIAEEFDCGYPAVSRFLKENGVSIRQGSSWGGRTAWRKQGKRLLRERRTRYNTPERLLLAKEIHRLYSDGDSMREIAQDLGLTKGAVRAFLSLDIS